MGAMKLTASRRRNIREAIANGAAVEVAARAEGVDPKTLALWRERNKAFDGEILQAAAKAEVALVGAIQKAAKSGSWHAARWLIDRASSPPEPEAKVSDDGDGDEELETESPLGFVDELADKRARQ